MKILHIAAWDYGGAGNAAYRLHQSLQDVGVDSHFLCYAKKKQDSTVHGIVHGPQGVYTQNKEPSYSPQFTEHFNRWTGYKQLPGADQSIELFSDTISHLNLLDLPIVQEADVLNFHWMPSILNLAELPQLSKEKKIVWTLHDMNAFTGGCHYADTCVKYQSQCQNCEQIGQGHGSPGQDLARSMFDLKDQVYKLSNMTIVTPSKWLGECSKSSTTLKDKPHYVIPYSLDVNVFKPLDQAECQRALGLDSNSRYLLFTAASAGTKRKGFEYLVASLNQLASRYHDVKVLVMGAYQPGSIQNCPLEIIPLGHLSDIHQVAQVYNAADVFVIPSLEDNLPNVVLESEACGTPVVGFDIGGIPDMVQHMHTGYLVPKGDVKSFAEGIGCILDLMKDNEQGAGFQQRCVENVHQKYLPEHQSKAYVNLYQSLLNTQSKNSTVTPQYEELNHLVDQIQFLISENRNPEALLYCERLKSLVNKDFN